MKYIAFDLYYRKREMFSILGVEWVKLMKKKLTIKISLMKKVITNLTYAGTEQSNFLEEVPYFYLLVTDTLL